METISFPLVDDTYASNEAMRLAAHLNRNVTIEGNLRMGFNIDNAWRWVLYPSWSGTEILVFEHTVGENDSDTDGIRLSRGYVDDQRSRHGAVSGRVMDRNGSETRSFPGYAGFPNGADHKVDGLNVVPVALVGTYTSTSGSKVVLTFNQGIEIPSLLQTFSDLVNVNLERFHAAVMDVHSQFGRPVEVMTGRIEAKKLAHALGRRINSTLEATLSYDYIFAADSAGMFLDSDSNVLQNFSDCELSNGSTATASIHGWLFTNWPHDVTVQEGSSKSYTIKLSHIPVQDPQGSSEPEAVTSRTPTHYSDLALPVQQDIVTRANAGLVTKE